MHSKHKTTFTKLWSTLPLQHTSVDYSSSLETARRILLVQAVYSALIAFWPPFLSMVYDSLVSSWAFCWDPALFVKHLFHSCGKWGHCRLWTWNFLRQTFHQTVNVWRYGKDYVYNRYWDVVQIGRACWHAQNFWGDLNLCLKLFNVNITFSVI